MTTEHKPTCSRWSVSYRQRWWRRRRYACSVYIHDEAVRCAEYMAGAGYRSVRIEVE